MRLSMLALSVSSLLAANATANQITELDLQPTTQLQAVTVTATRTEKTVLDSAQAINVISNAEIERTQATNAFDAISSIPNVIASGGPVPNGQKFSIRGFDQAEDVLVTIDGAVQTFEKYRMGSFFSDVDLYRQISVKRGPSTVLHGGGALGGLVQFELKDAADLLKPGEQYGAKVKLGHHSNNDQNNGSVFAYGAPTENSDFLVAVSKKESNDFELSDGNTLENSSIESDAFLVKGNYFIDDAQSLSASLSQTDDSKRSEYNTTDQGSWATIYREVVQNALNLSYQFQPSDNPLIDLTVKYGRTQSQVNERDPVGPYAAFLAQNGTYEYNIDTLDISNTSRLGKHQLTYGIEYTDKKRVGIETTSNVTGEVSSQPAGQQQRLGIFIQDEISFNKLTLVGGLRYEEYRSQATANLNSAYDNLDAEHDDVGGAISANYAINDNISVFYNYQQGFRAPLLDELYDTYQGRNPNPNLEIEHSSSNEFGVTYDTRNIITSNDVLTARLMHFDIDVDDEIISVTSTTAPQARYINTGGNSRDGIEFEVNYATNNVQVAMSYSNIDGKDETNTPLWKLPADKLTLDIGRNFIDKTVYVGMQWSKVSSRTVQIYDSATRTYSAGQHDGYQLTNLHTSWQLNDALKLQLSVDNIFDKEYQVVAGTGGGIGNYGVGRNVKTQLTYEF